MPNLTKTIKLRLNVTEEQVMLFRQMTERYRQGCNFVSQYIFISLPMPSPWLLQS